MSLFPRTRVDKHCLIACPPERCNCLAGAPTLYAAAIKAELHRWLHGPRFIDQVALMPSMIQVEELEFDEVITDADYIALTEVEAAPV